MPETSPLMSARNTGTPAAESCSAMSCSVFVLPVPVAPAMSPCRFIIESGMPTVGSPPHWPSCTTAPRVTAALPEGNAARAASSTALSIAIDDSPGDTVLSRAAALHVAPLTISGRSEVGFGARSGQGAQAQGVRDVHGTRHARTLVVGAV